MAYEKGGLVSYTFWKKGQWKFRQIFPVIFAVLINMTVCQTSVARIVGFFCSGNSVESPPPLFFQVFLCCNALPFVVNIMELLGISFKPLTETSNLLVRTKSFPFCILIICNCIEFSGHRQLFVQHLCVHHLRGSLPAPALQVHEEVGWHLFSARFNLFRAKQQFLYKKHTITFVSGLAIN